MSDISADPDATFRGGTVDPLPPHPVRSRLTRLVGPLVLVLLSFVMVLVHAPQNTAMSPIDEWVYVDYLGKVPTQLIVTQGEETGEFAREAIACNGVRLALDPNPALCSEVEAGDEADDAFPMQGVTSADIYTPLYFATTWVAAQPLTWFGVGLLDAATLVGGLWLALGMVLLYSSMRLLSVGRWVAVGIGALLIATPAAYWSSTYLSTDAPSLAVGAGLLYTALRIMTGRSGHVAFVVIAVAGVLFKVQNVAAVGLTALALLVWSLARARRDASESPGGRHWFVAGSLSRSVVAAVVAVFASVAGQAVWVVIRATASSGPSPDQGVSQTFSIKSAIQESLKFLGGTSQDPTGVANSIALVVAATAVSWLSIAGVVGLVVTARPGSPERFVSWAALVMALIAGPLLAVGVMAVSGFYFTLPVRYGISMLPAFLLCAGVLLSRNRRVSVVLTFVAAPIFIASLLGS